MSEIPEELQSARYRLFDKPWHRLLSDATVSDVKRKELLKILLEQFAVPLDIPTFSQWLLRAGSRRWSSQELTEHIQAANGDIGRDPRDLLDDVSQGV